MGIAVPCPVAAGSEGGGEQIHIGRTGVCDASLDLMKERFSAPEIARRKVTNLANLLRRHRVQLPDEAAAQIIQLAREALPPAAHRVITLQRSLTATIDLY